MSDIENSPSAPEQGAPSGPPVAATVPLRREHHGDVFIDQYEWLRNKEDAAVIAHLEAENAFTEARTADLEPLRQQIFGEIKARVKETDMSLPIRMGQWWYYSRSFEGKQYGTSVRRPIAGPDDWTPPEVIPEEYGDVQAGSPWRSAHAEDTGEETIFDSNAEAGDAEFFSLGSFDISDDGRRLAWAVDLEGDERYRLRIRDLATGADLQLADGSVEEVAVTSAGAGFSPDGEYVFYTTVDESWRPDTLWRHTVGTPSTEDVKVFHEPDDRYWVGFGVSGSNKFLMISLGSKITGETWVLDASDPTGEFRVVWPRREGVDYSVEHAIIGGKDRLLIVHNDGAENFEVVDTDAHDPRPLAETRVIVPHDPAIRVEGVEAFAGHLALDYRRGGIPRLALMTLADDYTEFEELHFPEELYSVGLGGNPEWDQPALRLGYGSYLTPSAVYSLDLTTGERTLLRQQEVQGGYDPAQYASKREWAIADDGTEVPLSLIWRRTSDDDDAVGGVHTPPSGAPALLYGYGSYEASMDPGFSVARLSLLDRGMLFAVAHVRGGGEMGRFWYEQGKTLTKKNTFTDFVAAADHLIERGYTTPDRLVAEGGSAGGLLMGAVANIAPDRFAGILADVPFVDPLTSILDPELPLTVIEWDEWGNPLEDPEVYAYMKQYSPYENVRDVEYPKILAITSLNDTRVLYVEPAKWVARLREVGADVLLKTEMSAGHGGVSGRYARWQETAYSYAWLIDTAGAA